MLKKLKLHLNMGIKWRTEIFLYNRIGIRIQSQLLMPVSWGGVYVGGVGSGATAGGSILQLNFSGGLIIGLGN